MSSIIPTSYSPGGCIGKQRRSGVISQKKDHHLEFFFSRLSKICVVTEGTGAVKWSDWFFSFFLNNSTTEETFVFSLPTQHAGVKMQEKPFVHPPTPTSSCSVCTVEEGYLTEKRLNICSSCTTGNFVTPAPHLKRKLITNTLTWLCWQGWVQYCRLHSSQGVVRTTHMFIHVSFYCTHFGYTVFDNTILGKYLSAKNNYVGFLQ